MIGNVQPTIPASTAWQVIGPSSIMGSALAGMLDVAQSSLPGDIAHLVDEDAVSVTGQFWPTGTANDVLRLSQAVRHMSPDDEWGYSQVRSRFLQDIRPSVSKHIFEFAANLHGLEVDTPLMMPLHRAFLPASISTMIDTQMVEEEAVQTLALSLMHHRATTIDMTRKERRSLKEFDAWWKSSLLLSYTGLAAMVAGGLRWDMEFQTRAIAIAMAASERGPLEALPLFADSIGNSALPTAALVMAVGPLLVHMRVRMAMMWRLGSPFEGTIERWHDGVIRDIEGYREILFRGGPGEFPEGPPSGP